MKSKRPPAKKDAPDSPSNLLPYLGSCGFCGQGLLRIWKRSRSKHAVALCDECELFWEDIRAVVADPSIPSSGVYSELVDDVDAPNWHAATRREIARLGLSELINGDSV